MLRNGTRLESQVCETQVIVVKTSESLNDLRAGGALMIPLGSDHEGGLALDPDLAQGNAVGKRYIDADGVEVLVTKSGSGTLAIGDVPLTLKEAKPLPASD
jgi:hypothetical protein